MIGAGFSSFLPRLGTPSRPHTTVVCTRRWNEDPNTAVTDYLKAHGPLRCSNHKVREQISVFLWEGIRATRHASDMIARRTSISCTVSRQTRVDMRCAPSQTQSSSRMLLALPCVEEQILSGDEGSQSASKKGNG